MFCKTVVSKVFDFIRTNGLIEHHDTVLIAFSGGPDSVFLTTLLSQYVKEVNGNISCCHINHGLRGETAERDEAFAERFAKERGIMFVSKHVDSGTHSREYGLSLEEAARQLRLDALEEVRVELNAQKIALAHTADDVVETFLFNLLRGTGRKGLSGIKPKRGRIIRPLISIKRDEIIRYLKKRGIDYRIDATNWKCDFTRNFIRHRLIPCVEQELKRNVKSSILQLITIMNNEEMLLSRMTNECFTNMCSISHEGITLPRMEFRKMDTALQRRLLVRCFTEMVKTEQWLNFKEIDAIRKATTGDSSGAVFSCRGVRFCIGPESILIAREEGSSGGTDRVTLQTFDEVTFCNRYRIRTEVIDRINGDIENRNCVYFDLDKLVLPLTMRSRRDGDRFVPFGMGHEKKVKELFIDEKVPFWERERIPVILDGKGIIWIAGIRRGAAAAVDEQTKRILKIEKRGLG
jgi:tRNA(Ile)-lysidine synthase